jgi:hypothetical protein
VTRGGERDLQLERGVEIRGEERDRRAGARDDPGERAVLLAELDDLREAGLEVQGRSLQVVVETLREHVRIPRSQRLQHVRVDPRLRLGREDVEGMPLAMPVELPVHLGRAQPELGERKHPLELALGERRAQRVAASGADRRSPQEREGHIRPDGCRELEQVLATEIGAPQRIAGEKRRRGIRRPAAHPPRDGHVLLDLEVDPVPVAGRVREKSRRADREIGAVGLELGEVDAPGELDREVRSIRRPNVLVERHGLVGRRDLVVAVVAERADPEEHVELSRGPRGHHPARLGGHCPNLVDPLRTEPQSWRPR